MARDELPFWSCSSIQCSNLETPNTMSLKYQRRSNSTLSHYVCVTFLPLEKYRRRSNSTLSHYMCVTFLPLENTEDVPIPHSRTMCVLLFYHGRGGGDGGVQHYFCIPRNTHHTDLKKSFQIYLFTPYPLPPLPAVFCNLFLRAF